VALVHNGIIENFRELKDELAAAGHRFESETDTEVAGVHLTEVAGRVCVLPVEAGCSVGEGDDIAFVEAMKMEIPVASPAAGKLKSILVSLDDVVAEGQVLAVIET